MGWILSLWLASAFGAEADLESLRYRNEALRAWLDFARSDSTYLAVDRQAGEVQLLHGRAVLRRCPILLDRLGPRPQSKTRLELHLRRYRPSSPWSVAAAGPFDWEHNLVEAANEGCALYFNSGLVLYAAAAWEGDQVRGVQVAPADLQALYNSCSTGTPLVVLPKGWNGEP